MRDFWAEEGGITPDTLKGAEGLAKSNITKEFTENSLLGKKFVPCNSPNLARAVLFLNLLTSRCRLMKILLLRKSGFPLLFLPVWPSQLRYW